MAELRLGLRDNGRTVEVAAGTRVVLTVPETPSTGYSWEPQPTSRDLAELEADSYEPPADLQPGAGGLHHFSYRARGAGEVPLRLVLRRPWEPDAFVERYEVILRIPR